MISHSKIISAREPWPAAVSNELIRPAVVRVSDKISWPAVVSTVAFSH